MPTLFRNLLIATGILSAMSLTLLGVIHYLGSRISQHHVSSFEDTIPLGRADLWSYVSDIPKQVEWNKGIIEVKALPPYEGHQVWRETYHTGDSMIFFISEVVAEQSLVRTIHQPSSPFQGYWKIEIVAESENSSRLIVTEHGQIKHTILRFVAHNIMGTNTFVKSYIENIKQVVSAEEG